MYPVRPEWTDPTGLTGCHDVLTNQYKVPQFLEAVLVATAHRDSPVFVVLDEMNLARVEYYFSDVLSAMESRQPIQLPPNLYVVGTINVDETTSTVSDKVLDRAVVIDMSAVDLPGFLAKLDERDPALAPSIAAAAGLPVGADRGAGGRWGAADAAADVGSNLRAVGLGARLPRRPCGRHPRARRPARQHDGDRRRRPPEGEPGRVRQDGRLDPAGYSGPPRGGRIPDGNGGRLRRAGSTPGPPGIPAVTGGGGMRRGDGN